MAKNEPEVEINPFTGLPPTLFEKAGDLLRHAESLITCAKYSLQYKDDPNTLIDGEEPVEGSDEEIKLLHNSGKLLHEIYDLLDADESARHRERTAAEKRTKKEKKSDKKKRKRK